MTRIARFAALAFALALAQRGYASGPDLWGDLDPGPHAVGIRILAEEDPSRSFLGRPRPIRIYLWVPASATTAPRMRFRDYADLAALDFGRDARIAAGSERIDPSLPIAPSFSDDGLAGLMRQPLFAVRDAEPAPGRHPLIVFGQGLDYESPLAQVVLCEYLASHGYVVATPPLLGVHSRLAGVEVRDVEAQIRDLEFTFGRVCRLPFVDPSRTALAGFDLGGISALLFQMRNPEIDALVTLDCAVQFESGLDVPHRSPDFDPDRLRVPWLHIGSSLYVRRDLPDLETRSLFARARYSEATVVWVDGVQHAAFTSYVMTAPERPLRHAQPFEANARPAHETVCRFVRRFLDAHLRRDPEAIAFLKEDPSKNAPPNVDLTVRHRSAFAPAPATADDILAALFETGLEEALRLAKSTRAEEAALDRAAAKVLRWGNSEWALALARLEVELHPESSSAYESLGDTHAVRGEMDEAVRCYRKALDLDPGAAHSKEKLERAMRSRAETPDR